MKQRETLVAYSLLAPFLFIFFVFLVYPVFYSFILSFYKTSLYTDWYNVFGDMTFAGLENYDHLLFEDEQFLWSLILTLYYSFLFVPTQILVALILALLLQKKRRGTSLFRTLFFLPTVLDTVVVGSIWLCLLAPQLGLFDVLLGRSQGVLENPWTTLPAIALVMVFKTAGFGMLLFLIAMQRVPPALYEAAKLDGASSSAQFFYITLPFLKPVFFFLGLTGIMATLNAFSEIYAMTNATGGSAVEIFGQTVHSAKISGYYLFQKFENGQYGEAAAISYILFVFALFISWSHAKCLGIFAHEN